MKSRPLRLGLTDRGSTVKTTQIKSAPIDGELGRYEGSSYMKEKQAPVETVACLIIQKLWTLIMSEGSS